jgi:hypothetical protein
VEIKSGHPNNDASLPSFWHPTRKDLDDDLKRSLDAWNYLRGKKEQYLPKETGEPEPAYRARLNRAVYSAFFRDGIETFAGILSRFELRDAPSTLQDLEGNIDNEGNDLTTFMMGADSMLLRDGGVCLGVEMPPNPAANRAQELGANIRPYFVARSRGLLLNWRTTYVAGVEMLQRATFLEMVELPDGDYGTKLEPRYRVIEPGRWTVYKIEQQGKGQEYVATVDVDEDGNERQGEYLQPNGQPLPVAPLVWYSADGDQWGEGGMPMRQVLEHDLEHFRTRSDLAEKTHKVAMPVPVRTGMPVPAPGMAPEPLTIGPNSVVDVPEGGGFMFAEPAASSLAEQRSQIEAIELLIKAKTANFAYGDGGNKTATQSALEAAHAQAGVSKLAARKDSALQQLMAIWALFTGEQLDLNAGINVSSTIYDRPLDPQSRQVLISEVDAGLLSRQSAVEILQRGGANPITQSPEDEMERLRGDERRMAAMVGVNDPVVTGEIDEGSPAELVGGGQQQPPT